MWSVDENVDDNDTALCAEARPLNRRVCLLRLQYGLDGRRFLHGRSMTALSEKRADQSIDQSQCFQRPTFLTGWQAELRNTL